MAYRPSELANRRNADVCGRSHLAFVGCIDISGMGHRSFTYRFCVWVLRFHALAAITGQRGLSYVAVGLGKVVYLGNMVGAFASIIGAVVLLFAAYVSL